MYYLCCDVVFFSFRETVDGRNPVTYENLRKTWDILHINWLAGYLNHQQDVKMADGTFANLQSNAETLEWTNNKKIGNTSTNPTTRWSENLINSPVSRS